MHAAILSKLTNEPDDTNLQSHLGNELPAVEVEATEYLDGRTIHHGTLAGEVGTETDVPFVSDEGIYTEPGRKTWKITAQFYADLEAGWAGVNTGDGEDLLGSYLAGEAGVMREDAVIRLDAWAEEFERKNDADTWGVSFSQDVESGFSEDRAGAYYHSEADVNMMPKGVSALGFSYRWDGRLVRGMIAESGYVAVYKDWDVDMFARWVADEVEPYLEYDRDEQQTLKRDTEETDEDAEEACDECGSVPKEYGLHEDAGDEVCIICKDKREEEREEAVADGGDDDV